MKKAGSSLCILFSVLFYGVLFLTSGCSQQKVFDFSAPVAHVKTTSKAVLEDSVQAVALSSEAAMPSISQEAYQVEASTTPPVPAKLSPRYTRPSVIPTQPLGASKKGKLATRKGKARAQDSTSPSLPLPPESKAAMIFTVIALIMLGILLFPGFTLGTYVTGMVIGFIAFLFSFIFGLIGKNKGTKQPEKYDAKGAKSIGIVSWVLAGVLALVLLSLLGGD